MCYCVLGKAAQGWLANTAAQEGESTHVRLIGEKKERKSNNEYYLRCTSHQLMVGSVSILFGRSAPILSTSERGQTMW